MNNTKLRIAELDFDSIRTNLKSFLSDQSEFTDYNFDGSGMSVLLDILAYNTHYNSYYLNMVANEMFLDSAIERDSIVSIAKHLGYVTKSSTAGSATVVLSVSATEEDNTKLPNSIGVPKFTKFTTTLDGTTYVFHTLESYLVTVNGQNDAQSNGLYTRTYADLSVEIYEGQHGTITYAVSESGFVQKYIIPSKNADTSSLTVTVHDSATDSTKDTYTLHSGLSDLTSTSKVYFLQEVEGQQYEISFGDGILGNKLSEGNIITIDYLKTNGDVVNGAGSSDSISNRTFSISTPLSYSPQYTAPTTVASVTSVVSGGVTDPESLESIKFNAPKTFQSQNRAVTKSDYESLVLSKFPNAASTMVWSGEDNKPVPDNGSVYISIRPVTGLILNDVQKSDLKLILDKYKVLSITPKVVDPDYTFIKVNSVVAYNSGIALNPRETVRDSIISTIKNYNDVYLSEFEKPFRFSKLVSLIDETDDSIISNRTTITLKKRIKVSKSDLNKAITSIDLSFNNKILHNWKATWQEPTSETNDVVGAELPIGEFYSDPFLSDRSGVEYASRVATAIAGGTSGSAVDLMSYAVKIVDDANAGLNVVKVKDNALYNPFEPQDANNNASFIPLGDFGDISYGTGLVTIPSLTINSLIPEDSEYLYFYVDVVENDIRPDFNQILTILDSDISVTVKTEAEIAIDDPK